MPEWKLKELVRKHKIRVAKISRVGEIPKTTIYRNIELETMPALSGHTIRGYLITLNKLRATQEFIQLADLVEIVLNPNELEEIENYRKMNCSLYNQKD